MGILKNALKNGISKGVSSALNSVIQKTIEPKATELVNKAADKIEDAFIGSEQQNNQSAQTTATEQTTQTASRFGGLASAFAGFEQMAKSYATEMTKNLKVCPNCGQPAAADTKFCQSCGTKLPEQTVAQGAVCTNCGKQNDVGTKFCAACGTKLPAAVAEEQAAAAKDAAVMAEWDEKLSQYPKWSCGGKEFGIESYNPGQYIFSASFDGGNQVARAAVEQYRSIVLQSGFRQAGQYPSNDHLYQMVGGACFHVDLEHCFEGDADRADIGFSVGEPVGGFNYVKPEPKKSSWKDLFGL